MLDLQQLRYFVAVAETESVARAAVQLHISQSPLSRQVMALEARLGLSLFARARQRLTLTPAGRAFLEQARELLRHAQRVEQQAIDAARLAGGTLVIGFVESAVHCGVLRDAVHALRRASPEATVELRALRTAEQWAALQSGTIDLGFGHAPAPEATRLHSVRLADEPFVLAMPAGHPLTRGALTASRLDGQPFIALPASVSAPGRDALLAACGRAGFTPRIVLEAADPSVVLGLVQSGFGLALVQQSLGAAAKAGVACRPLPAAFDGRVQVYRTVPAAARPLAAALVARGEPAGQCLSCGGGRIPASA